MRSNSNAQKSEKRVQAPAASGTVIVKQKPLQNNKKSYVICNRELFLDIVAVTNVNGTSKINPGNSAMFKWASKIARNYDQFRFKKLHFVWKSRSPSNTDGKIVFAVDYDPADIPAADIPTIETFEGCVSANVWIDEVIARKEIVFKCDIAKLHPNGRRKYICTSGYCPSGDLQDVFCGRFNYITDTSAALGINIGEFWVDYEIELFAAQTSATTLTTATLDGFSLQLNAVNTNFFSAWTNSVKLVNSGATGNACPGALANVSPSGVINIDNSGVVTGLVPGIVKVNYLAYGAYGSSQNPVTMAVVVDGVTNSNQIIQLVNFNATKYLPITGTWFVNLSNNGNLLSSNTLAISVTNNNGTGDILTLSYQTMTIEYVCSA